MTLTQSPTGTTPADDAAQLPMADVANATRPPDPPGLLRRMKWAYYQAERLELSGVEASVLRHVAYRAATSEVWESLDGIAAEIRFSRRTVSCALSKCIDSGIMTKQTRFAMPSVYRLIWLSEEAPNQNSPSAGQVVPGIPIKGNSEKEKKKRRELEPPTRAHAHARETRVRRRRRQLQSSRHWE